MKRSYSVPISEILVTTNSEHITDKVLEKYTEVMMQKFIADNTFELSISPMTVYGYSQTHITFTFICEVESKRRNSQKSISQK